MAHRICDFLLRHTFRATFAQEGHLTWMPAVTCLQIVNVRLGVRLVPCSVLNCQAFSALTLTIVSWSLVRFRPNRNSLNVGGPKNPKLESRSGDRASTDVLGCYEALKGYPHPSTSTPDEACSPRTAILAHFCRASCRQEVTNSDLWPVRSLPCQTHPDRYSRPASFRGYTTR